MGRLHLPGIFAAEGAVAVHRALAGPVPWMKCMRAGGEAGDVPMADWDATNSETNVVMILAFMIVVTHVATGRWSGGDRRS